ncbi:hypothetical protein TcG_00492, partial [Trypanosoma cruzi]
AEGILPHARDAHTADGLCAAGGTFGTAGESLNAPWVRCVGFWGRFWRRSDPPCWRGRRGDGAVERATANTANLTQLGWQEVQCGRSGHDHCTAGAPVVEHLGRTTVKGGSSGLHFASPFQGCPSR